MMWGYGSQSASWLWMLMMMIFGLLVLIGIVLLIVWAVRQGGDHQGYRQHPSGGQHYGQQQQWHPTQSGMVMPPPGQAPGQAPGGQGMPGSQGMHGGQQRDPAVDAARERFARGEITKEQLDEIMRHLGY